MRLSTLITVFATTTACADDLPQPHEVEDLRVLAIRADPPELLYDAPQERQVTFEALVVDPRGGALDYRWRFCPVESDASCSHWEADRQSVPPTRREVLDELLAGSDADTGVIEAPVRATSGALSTAASDATTLSPYAVAPYVATIPTELVSHHVESTLLGYGMGVWPAAMLELSRGGEQLSAIKRVVLNIRDPGAVAALFADQLGATVCTAPGQTNCLDLPIRQPNRNPEIASLSWAEGERADGTFVPVPDGEPLTVRAGESLRIRPELADGSDETYWVLATELTDASLYVDHRREQISVAWFCAAGELQDNITWPIGTRTLDTAYTAPKVDSERFAETDTVWMVARDQRGGVGWHHIEIQITQ